MPGLPLCWDGQQPPLLLCLARAQLVQLLAAARWPCGTIVHCYTPPVRTWCRCRGSPLSNCTHALCWVAPSAVKQAAGSHRAPWSRSVGPQCRMSGYPGNTRYACRDARARVQRCALRRVERGSEMLRRLRWGIHTRCPVRAGDGRSIVQPRCLLTTRLRCGCVRCAACGTQQLHTPLRGAAVRHQHRRRHRHRHRGRAGCHGRRRSNRRGQ